MYSHMPRESAVIKINIPLHLQALRLWNFPGLILDNWPMRRLHSVYTVLWLDDIRVWVQRWKEILFCLSSSCLPNVTSVSGLSNLHCPHWFSPKFIFHVSFVHNVGLSILDYPLRFSLKFILYYMDILCKHCSSCYKNLIVICKNLILQESIPRLLSFCLWKEVHID